MMPSRVLLKMASAEDSTMAASRARASLDPLARGDVSNRTAHQNPLRRLQRTETDFDRKLAAVLSPAKQFEPDSHGPHSRVGEKITAMTHMRLMVAFGHQQLQRLAQQLFPPITKQPLGLRVYQDDASVLADNDRGIRRRLHKTTEFRFAGLQRQLRLLVRGGSRSAKQRSPALNQRCAPDTLLPATRWLWPVRPWLVARWFRSVCAR